MYASKFVIVIQYTSGLRGALNLKRYVYLALLFLIANAYSKILSS